MLGKQWVDTCRRLPRIAPSNLFVLFILMYRLACPTQSTPFFFLQHFKADAGCKARTGQTAGARPQRHAVVHLDRAEGQLGRQAQAAGDGDVVGELLGSGPQGCRPRAGHGDGAAGVEEAVDLDGVTNVPPQPSRQGCPDVAGGRPEGIGAGGVAARPGADALVVKPAHVERPSQEKAVANVRGPGPEDG